MRYQVTMQRTITQLASFDIEAADKKDAVWRANAMRETVDWDTTDADYDIPDIEEVA